MRTTDSTRFSEYPLLIAKGFAMGSADVVPGVSGGTLALITGVYERFLAAIKSLDAEAVRLLLTFRWGAAFERIHWRFLVGLVTGIFSALLFFTRVVPLPVLMTTHPEPVYGLFFGLIVGSIRFLARDIGQFDLKLAGWVFLGTAIGFWIVNLVPTDTPESAWFVFLSGAVAICAMVLPGISGSFILLILRKYDYVFGQIGLLGGPQTLDALLVLVPFGLGIIVGITSFARFLTWLLGRFRMPTMATLTGFLIGTLWVIWPWQERVFEDHGGKSKLVSSDPVWPVAGTEAFWWGLAMMAVGFALVWVVEKAAERR